MLDKTTETTVSAKPVTADGSPRPKVLFAASEVYPLIKTGGLADVASFLPVALHDAGYDIRIILPAYGGVLAKGYAIRSETAGFIPETGVKYQLREIRLPGHEVPVYLIHVPELYDRPGGPYHGPDNNEWPDNHLRFALFCRVIRQICLDQAGLDWQPDILHGNDWHTGLAPALLSQDRARPAIVFTIHSLAYQGLFPLGTFSQLGLPDSLQSPDALEFYGQLSFMKGGLVYADKVVTVSPSYAREITTPAFGVGLDSLLRMRNSHLTGILNGVDYDVWDPRHDPLIYSHYWIDRLSGKTTNKQHIQRELGLAENNNAILLGFIGRLTEQKGCDLILDELAEILGSPDIQLIILGEGARRETQALKNAAAAWSGRMVASFTYDETLAHRIQAGADILLMPSRFEPCGLSQLYALRYGTIPVTSLTGGLIDTIVDTNDFSLQNHTATGFHFSIDTPGDFVATLLRATKLYRDDKTTWRQLMHTAMIQEFSWSNAAGQYSSIYQHLLTSRHVST